MTGDELITYGFKRITDQLTELIDYSYQINDRQSQDQTNKYLANISTSLSKIENHLFTMVGIQLAMQDRLDQTRADAYTTALNVIRIEQSLKQGDSDNDGSEDV